MKTLKKTLALVLALVMAFGVFGAVPAGAFTDDKDIENKDAVDLLANLGILNGFEDGSFKPDDILTRAQGAKIIAALFLTPAVANALPKVNTKFTDVTADHWASPFIDWAVANGIIDGYGDGKFGPEDQLTGLQFLKMLLAGLGYGAKGEFLGDRWGAEVARLAQTIGLSKNAVGTLTNSPLSRELAALLASNAITGDDVKFVTFVEFLNEYTTGGVLGTGSETSLSDKGHYDVATVKGTIGFDSKEHNFTFTANAVAGNNAKINVAAPKAEIAQYGRTVEALVINANTEKTAKVVGVVKTTDTVIFESWSAVNFANVTNSTHSSYKAPAAASISLIANGATTNGLAVSGLTNTTNGTLTLLINTAGDAKGAIDMVVTIVNTFGFLTEDAATKTSGNDTNVVLKGTAADGKASNSVFGFDGLKKNDGVIVTEMNGSEFGTNNHYWVAKAAVITGKLDGFDGTSKVSFDKKNYNVSNIFSGGDTHPATSGVVAATKFGNDYDVYLDFGGNVIAMKTTDADKTQPYYLVLATANGSGFNFSDVIFRVMDMDGKTSEILTTESALGSWIGTFITYEESDTAGKYDVALVTGAGITTTGVTTIAAYDAGKTNIITLGSTTYRANSATKFFFVKGDKVTLYTGVANTPKLDSATDAKTANVVLKDGIATHVYFTYTGDLSGSGETKNIVYVIDKPTALKSEIVDGKNVAYYEVSVISTKGVESKVKVKSTSATSMALINNTAATGTHLVEAKTGADGFTTFATTTITNASGVNAKPANEMMGIGATSFAYNSDTVFVTVTKRGTSAPWAATIEEGVSNVPATTALDNVIYGVDKDNTNLLTYVIVEVVAAPATTYAVTITAANPTGVGEDTNASWGTASFKYATTAAAAPTGTAVTGTTVSLANGTYYFYGEIALSGDITTTSLNGTYKQVSAVVTVSGGAASVTFSTTGWAL